MPEGLPPGAPGFGLISEREEAMKVVLPDLEPDPNFAERFLREIRLQASLDHPNIASLHTAVRLENRILMLMQLVEGTSLERRMSQGPSGRNFFTFICSGKMYPR